MQNGSSPKVSNIPEFAQNKGAILVDERLNSAEFQGSAGDKEVLDSSPSTPGNQGIFSSLVKASRGADCGDLETKKHVKMQSNIGESVAITDQQDPKQLIVSKLNNQSKENHQLRLEHQCLAKEISVLKLECSKHETRQRTNYDQRLKDIENNRRLERELKRMSLENKKLKKQTEQLIKNTQQADSLFRETLKVKLQYEEILSKLCEDKQIASIVNQAIKT